LFIQTHVALQRKGVKPNEFADAIESPGKCPQILKELPQAGVHAALKTFISRAQCRSEDTHATAIPRLSIDGSY
jgi:hypothetical protein